MASNLLAFLLVVVRPGAPSSFLFLLGNMLAPKDGRPLFSQTCIHITWCHMVPPKSPRATLENGKHYAPKSSHRENPIVEQKPALWACVFFSVSYAEEHLKVLSISYARENMHANWGSSLPLTCWAAAWTSSRHWNHSKAQRVVCVLFGLLACYWSLRWHLWLTTTSPQAERNSELICRKVVLFAIESSWGSICIALADLAALAERVSLWTLSGLVTRLLTWHEKWVRR